MIEFIENLLNDELYFIFVVYASLNIVVQLLFVVTVFNIGKQINK